MASSNTLRPSIGRILQNNFPSLATPSAPSLLSLAPFSTSAPLCKRRKVTNRKKVRGSNRDMNPGRGVSSIYRSGPREPLSMSNIPLPRPADFKPKVKVDENHGLWGFFAAPGKLLPTPEETEKHGRAWKVEELRKKSWEDLHSLWWVCCRERNMLATSKVELKRSGLGFGKQELENRDEEVRKTMGAIRHTLTERFYTWQDAVEVAKTDDEINMDAEEGGAYIPSSYEEDEVDLSSGWEEPAADLKTSATQAAVLGEDSGKAETKPEKPL